MKKEIVGWVRSPSKSRRIGCLPWNEKWNPSGSWKMQEMGEVQGDYDGLATCIW